MYAAATCGSTCAHRITRRLPNEHRLPSKQHCIDQIRNQPRVKTDDGSFQPTAPSVHLNISPGVRRFFTQTGPGGPCTEIIGGRSIMRKVSGRVVVASLSLVVAAVGCSNDAAPPPSDTGLTAALVSIQNNFDDGTTQGWIPRGPVTLTSTTEQAFAGTRSLKTTGRTAGFHGPSLNLTGVLAKGATYSVGVSVRLVTGEAPTTIRMTMQRDLVGGGSAFDT